MYFMDAAVGRFVQYVTSIHFKKGQSVAKYGFNCFSECSPSSSWTVSRVIDSYKSRRTNLMLLFVGLIRFYKSSFICLNRPNQISGRGRIWERYENPIICKVPLGNKDLTSQAGWAFSLRLTEVTWDVTSKAVCPACQNMGQPVLLLIFRHARI